jgi:hypothetical protein
MSVCASLYIRTVYRTPLLSQADYTRCKYSRKIVCQMFASSLCLNSICHDVMSGKALIISVHNTWLCALGPEGANQPWRMFVNGCTRSLQLGIRMIHRRLLSDEITSNQRMMEALFVSLVARRKQKVTEITMLKHCVRFIMCSDTDTLSNLTVIQVNSCDCLDDYDI